MQSRHAATFALVGWYLLVPSVGYQSATNVWTMGGYDEHGKPVYSDWRTYGSYDTAAECQNHISGLDPTESPVIPTDEGAIRNPIGLAKVVRAAVKQAICIKADDPRLKSN